MKHYKGNTKADGKGFGGWFVCSDERLTETIRYSEDVEIKYSSHKAGESRDKSKPVRTDATAVTILLNGNFTMSFPDKVYTLEKPGDYIFWKPGIEHDWKANEGSTMLTIRWPSKPK